MISWDKIEEKANREGVSVPLVLKENVQWLILDFLFREGAFSDLVFQGGTALRIVYRGVRYSEDLDFVLREKNAALFSGFTRLLGGLPGFLEKNIPFSRQIRLKAQKETETFKRYSLILETENLPHLDKTNIEVANVPSYENEPVLIQDPEVFVNPVIRVETPEEILSDKFCAFGSRKYVKGRDLWDIFYLLETMRIPLTEEGERMVRKKILDYRLTPEAFGEKFGENLRVLHEKGTEIFEEEMARFLPRAYRENFAEQTPLILKKVSQALKSYREQRFNRES